MPKLRIRNVSSSVLHFRHVAIVYYDYIQAQNVYDFQTVAYHYIRMSDFALYGMYTMSFYIRVTIVTQ